MAEYSDSPRSGDLNDRRVVVDRTFDAPREALFEAFTDPKLMAQWFAPEPLTVPLAEIDARPGGRYTLVMRDEQGNDFTGVGEYREVVRPERLVYTDSSAEMPSGFLDMVNEARNMPHGTPVPDGIVTVTFEDAGGRTKVTYMEEFDSPATREAWVQMQMVEGLEGGFDKLEKVLTQSPSMTR